MLQRYLRIVPTNLPLVIFTPLVLLLVMACSSIDMPQEKLSDGYGRVQISMNAPSQSAIEYPVTIYALDENGDEVSEITIESSTASTAITLQEGSYTLAAVCGNRENPNGSTESPLAYGKSDVTVTPTTTSATISMAYAVASVDVTLTSIPSDVTAVKVGISPQYTTMSLLGDYSGSTAVEATCSPTGTAGEWKTPSFFLLPGTGTKTTMTITLTNAKGDTSYSSEYDAPLLAATPYHFNGAYNGAKAKRDIQVSLTIGEWLTDVSNNFEFGKETTETPSGGNTGGLPVMKVSTMPTAGSVCNGHVVALVDGNTALLFSKEHFSSIKPSNALKTAADYEEDGMTGWSVPTVDDVKALNAYYSDADKLAVLRNACAVAVGKTDDTTLKSNRDFLCDEGKQLFQFFKSTFTTPSSSATYHLRLVKKVAIVVQ